MTKKINVTEYLKSPDECPFCNSEDISAGEVDFSYINVWRTVLCENCRKKWQEEFTITNVRAYDKNDNIEEE